MNTETIDYKGLAIEIMQDDCPEMPWKSWDGNPPFFSFSDRSFDTDFAPDMDEIIALIPRSNWKDLAMAGLSERDDTVIRDFLEAVRHYDLRDWEDQREHLVGELDMEDLEVLEELCNLANVPCYASTSQGHCQGHWAELLIIGSPSWIKEVGIAEEHVAKSLESAADLWGAWAWGDVYGFVVPDENQDPIGSCWSFYGDDHEESGLLEHAKSDIDFHLEQKRKSRLDQVKTWIKNRVPLSSRLTLA